ncbi:MAG: helix-turn-helix transcriptional regulator [Clostridia bacterium]|nr:helix-turn-helix transcriptional regulator [Clostridia bacterium]
MYYEFDVSRLPEITDIYSVRRRTVWQIVDSDTLLILAVEGRCRITMDNCDYILNPGSVFIVPARHHYVRRPIDMEMCTLRYVHIRLSEPPAPLEDDEARRKIAARRHALPHRAKYGDEPPESLHSYITEPLIDLAERAAEFDAIWEEAMTAHLKNHADCATVGAIAAIRLLLILADRTAKQLPADAVLPTGSLPDTNYRKLRRVIAYIRLHSKETITLDDLCRVCNFTKQHLIRIFRAEFGKTPKAFILEYKINCAKELFFRNPHLTVKEVADEMGFEDQHYFSRLFTKITGVTPTDYKNHLITFNPDKQ